VYADGGGDCAEDVASSIVDEAVRTAALVHEARERGWYDDAVELDEDGGSDVDDTADFDRSGRDDCQGGAVGFSWCDGVCTGSLDYRNCVAACCETSPMPDTHCD
jgi:hypothetical protein